MSPLATVAALRGYSLWSVAIGNNYYNGRYADYGFKSYPVIASSAEEAKSTVLRYADEILEDLLSKRYSEKRRMLPPRSALRITQNRLGRAEKKILLSTAADRWKRVISPEGWVEVQLKQGEITDWRQLNETDNT